MNSAKFAVILAMEKQLPGAPFTEEWSQLQGGHAPVSDAEKWVPLVFTIIYLVIIALNALPLLPLHAAAGA